MPIADLGNGRPLDRIRARRQVVQQDAETVDIGSDGGSAPAAQDLAGKLRRCGTADRLDREGREEVDHHAADDQADQRKQDRAHPAGDDHAVAVAGARPLAGVLHDHVARPCSVGGGRNAHLARCVRTRGSHGGSVGGRAGHRAAGWLRRAGEVLGPCDAVPVALATATHRVGIPTGGRLRRVSRVLIGLAHNGRRMANWCLYRHTTYPTFALWRNFFRDRVRD